MRKIFQFISISLLTLIFACGGSGVSKDAVGRVWDEYIYLKIEVMNAGKQTNDATLQMQAAQKHQFSSWGKFVNRASKDLGVKDWNTLSRQKSMELGKKIAEVLKEKKE